MFSPSSESYVFSHSGSFVLSPGISSDTDQNFQVLREAFVQLDAYVTTHICSATSSDT